MAQIILSCDAGPLRLFIKLFQGALQRRQRPFDFGDLTFELARVENDFSATAADELIVRLYPSDAFLRFAAALLAGDVDLGTVKETGHDCLLKVNPQENESIAYLQASCK